MLARLLFLLFSFVSTTMYGLTPAERLLNSVDYAYCPVSIIDKNEWKELQLDRLLQKLDRTTTVFGKWGLSYLLQPICNGDEIRKRQEIISFLVENEDVLHHFQKQLSIIKKNEDALLSYWDKSDSLNNNCEQFYYALPLIKDHLNKSSVALNIGVVTQMANAARNLVMSLCLNGLADELWMWAQNDKYEFNAMKALKNGLARPLEQHSLSLKCFKGRESDEYTLKDVLKAETTGTLGDRYHVYSRGYSFDPGMFGLPSDWNLQIKKSFSLLQKSGAFFYAGIQTACYDYFWGAGLVTVLKNIAFMYSSLQNLTERTIATTTCFSTMARLMKEMNMCGDVFGKYAYFDKNHHEGITLIQNIAQQLKAHKSLYHYSRGHSLVLHKEINKIKKQIIPLLQTVALLDAFCSIAQLYKEHQDTENKFCFVDFADSKEPFMAYENAWLPLLPQGKAVHNNIYFGKDRAGKIVITGPNGGGKSTMLKQSGMAALAQGWGIYPASHAEQTLFYAIKTGLSSQEDLSQGLSTFMAEKKCMEEIEAFIKKMHDKGSVLVLIDEPYKGTVDDESAKRIYNFGMRVAPYKNVLMGIATHVKKPIFLAKDTHGIFANYHVEIKETSLGIFERCFILKDGPATWWFENEDQRGRFVDWLSTVIISQENNARKYTNILRHATQ